MPNQNFLTFRNAVNFSCQSFLWNVSNKRMVSSIGNWSQYQLTMVVVAYTKQNFTRKEMARLPKRYERKNVETELAGTKHCHGQLALCSQQQQQPQYPTDRHTHTHTHLSLPLNGKKRVSLFRAVSSCLLLHFGRFVHLHHSFFQRKVV